MVSGPVKELWRAFAPAKQEADLSDLPAWFVSFDGEHFVEVNKKPEMDFRIGSVRSGWLVAVFGPRRMKRGQSRLSLLPVMQVTRKMLTEWGCDIEHLEVTTCPVQS